MDAYHSQDTVIYRPTGNDALEAVTLCKYLEKMASPVDVRPQVQVQREPVIGSSWMHQAARGNASFQMSFSVARAFPSTAAARAWGLDLSEMLALYPEGIITWLSCYYDGQPQRIREYHATLDNAYAPYITGERYFGDVLAAWQVVELQFTLTGDID